MTADFRPPSRRRSGFTLIEVMVALMIFTLAAVVLGSSYLNILNSYEIARQANERNEDLDFARSQLLVTVDLAQAEKGDEFDADGGRHVHWTAQIDPTVTVDLFAVTFKCEINDPAAKEPEDITENFMILRPTWSDPTDRSKLLADVKARIDKLQGVTP